MSTRTARTALAVVTAASLTLLAGCSATTNAGAPAEDGPYTAVASDVTAEITVSNWGDPGDKAIYDDVATRFKEKYPNVTVKNDFTPITTWTEYVNKLVSSVAAGNAPDVINIATEGVELGIYNDLFAPLDGYIDNDPEGADLVATMDPQLMNGFAKNDKQYLIPNTWNTMLVYYNTKMFADAGIERPSDDWTWDDFLSIAEKLTTGSGDSKVYGFGLPYFNFGITPWLYSNSASQMNADLTEPTLDDSATVEAAEWVRDLVTEHEVSPQPKGSDPYQLFPAGKVAMTGAGHWLVGPFAEAGFSDYDVLPWPKKTEQATVSGGGGFAISQQSENKDIAWEFIKMLTDSTTQDKWASAGAAIPATKAAATSEEFLAFPEHADLFYGASAYSRPVAAPSVFNTLEPSFMRAMDSILSGSDAKEALAKANQEVKDALASE